MVITETELRARFAGQGEKTLSIPKGAILTTAAKDYIRERGIRLLVGEGVPENPGEKPEQMTHLRSGLLVEKTHPRILFRGKLDHLQAEILLAQQEAEGAGERELLCDLEELLGYARELLGCEVKEEPFVRETLLGMTEAGLRDASHHPKSHFGVEHFFPDYRMGPVMLRLNLVRTLVRETELAAVAAFCPFCKEGSVERLDLIRALNRMSSAVYIMECRLLAAIKEEKGEQPWMKSW